MPDEAIFYETLPHIRDDVGEVTLAASFTPNNGIRIGLLDTESSDPDWREFDFEDEQAEMIGQALIRWAQRRTAANDDAFQLWWTNLQDEAKQSVKASRASPGSRKRIARASR